MKRLGTGRKKWLWRIVFLALPLIVMGVVLSRLKTWRPRPTIQLQGQTPTWLAWTPDGKHLAIGSTSGIDDGQEGITCHLSLWDVAEAKQLWHKTTVEPPYIMASDGRIFANGEDLQIFNAKGQLLDHDRQGSGVFAVGGNWLAQGDDGRPITLWNLKESAADDTPRAIGTDGQFCHAIALSPDGKLLASSDFTDLKPQDKKDNAVHIINLWDVKTGKLLRRISYTQQEVQGLAFSPDSKQLVGRVNATVFIWNPATVKVVRRIPLTLESQIVFSPDGRWMAADANSALKVYDAKTGALKRTLAPPQKAVISPVSTSSPSGNIATNVVSPSSNAVTKTMGVATPVKVGAFAFSPDSSTLAIGYNSGTVTLWRMK